MKTFLKSFLKHGWLLWIQALVVQSYAVHKFGPLILYFLLLSQRKHINRTK